jgi:hypothetical protein
MRSAQYRAPCLLVVLGVLTLAAWSEADEPTGDGTVASTVPATSPETTTATPIAPPLYPGLGDTVTLLTPQSGGGERPLLEWEPVSGADRYVVYLYAPSGDTYWVWMGFDTAVFVGGNPQLRAGASGPSVVDGMAWAVAAKTFNGVSIAVSELRPIAP